MEKLLSARQVADHLNMHVQTLYTKIRENTISLNVIQKGGRMGFRPSDVERYLSQHEVTRDGSGKPRKKAGPKRPIRFIKIELPDHSMTDKEAQDFFEGVENVRRFPAD